MAERRVTVASRIGLHARPAARFVAEAARQPVAITIAKEGKEPADASSILSVLALDVRGGNEVVLRAEGEDAEHSLDELVELLSRDLDAGE